MKDILILMPNDALSFILMYILYLVVQSLFINGVRIAATGTTTVLPDGTERDSEMILYPLYKWLCEVVKRKIYYAGNEKQKLMINLNMVLGPGWMNDYPADTVLFKAKQLDPDIELEVNDQAEMIFFKWTEEYKYSKYIRKPIIQCIICMASFWGLFTYWLPVGILMGVNIFTIILWIINTVCLSYTNYLIYKKL